MKTMLKTTLAAAAFVAMTAVSALAATVTVNNTPDLLALSTAGTVTLPAGTTTSVAPLPLPIVSGSIGSQYRSPFEGLGAGNFANIQYFTVGSPSVATSGSPFSMMFAGLQTSFEILWGSVDTYNTIVFKNGSSVVATIQGGVGVGPATGEGAVLVKVTGINFDNVDFISTQAAFEFSNITTTAIPLPAGGLLLLTALGGIAALRRRKTA